MPEKVKLSEQQVLVNRFAFCLLKHFNDAKIKVQDTAIKIQVEQLCGQDFDFINALDKSISCGIGINVRRSGKGIALILGVAKVKEMPLFLKEYKRDHDPVKSY